MTDSSSNGRSGSTAIVGGKTVTWIERKLPTKFEFVAGIELGGVLVDHGKRTLTDPKTRQEKEVNRYLVDELETGATVFFHGTSQLDDLLRPDHVGHFVRIIYKGEDQGAGRHGNAMKLFQVFVSLEMAPGWAGNGTRITDEDLPDESFMA
jgi:hypothetical protein